MGLNIITDSDDTDELMYEYYQEMHGDGIRYSYDGLRGYGDGDGIRTIDYGLNGRGDGFFVSNCGEYDGTGGIEILLGDKFSCRGYGYGWGDGMGNRKGHGCDRSNRNIEIDVD